jgi:hypothetical protein
LILAVVPLMVGGAALVRHPRAEESPPPVNASAPASFRVGPRLPVRLPPPAGVGREAGSQMQAQRPVSIELPGGAVMPVEAVATGPRGVLQLSSDIGRAGWWVGSSRLGDPFGATVVAGHVDSFTQGVGPFAALLAARRGDLVRLAGRDLSQRFRVTSVRLVPRASLNAGSPEYSPYGDRRLVLVTCGGPYDATTQRYRDNLVVVAVPEGGLERR